MKKILFVVHTLQVGGAEKILINILRNIDKNKYNITVLAIVDDGILVDTVKKIEGVKYKYIFKSYFKKTRANKESKFYKIANKVMSVIWKRFLRKIKNSSEKIYAKNVKEKYDVEIAFLEGKVSKFVSSSNNKTSKKIAWIHTDINSTPNVVFCDKEDEIKCYKKFDKIVCVSSEVRDRFIQKTEIKDNVIVQVNPIDSIDVLEKSVEKLEDNIDRDVLSVCSVGRLVNIKGYDRLLEAHKRLLEDNINHTLWIVGEGEEKTKLQQYIRDNKLDRTAHLVGYTNNPYKYVNNCDIFICSSRVEGLSSAILEATVLEKIIISTDCPGSREILGNNNENALIVKNDTDGIYEGLKEVLTNEKLRNQYKENIKSRSKLFNLNTTIKQIEKIIDE